MDRRTISDKGNDTRRPGYLGASFLLLISVCIPQTFAGDLSPIAPASIDQETNTGAGTGVVASPVTTLPLKVQKAELSLEKLRDIGLDLKHVLKAASSLYDDVMIAPVRLLTEPEVVGGAVMISLPVATQPIGPPEPPNKERIDLAMNEIKTVITMMKKNVDAFVGDGKNLDLPDNVRQVLEPQFDNWIQMVNTMAGREEQLEEITQGPPYNNLAIAALAIDIQKDVKELDRIRREIYKVIRKEGKRIAAYEQSQ